MDVDKSDPAYHATEKDLGNPGRFSHEPVRVKPTTTCSDFGPVPDMETSFLLAGRDELARELGIADRSVSPCLAAVGSPDISRIAALQGYQVMGVLSIVDVTEGGGEKGRFVGGRE